jgi:hypothetical protein
MPVLIATKTVIPSEIRTIWGKPALLAIEDPALYDRLSEGIANAVEPIDVIDWLLVKDAVDFTWQLYRLRRIQAKLLEPTTLIGKTFKALAAGSADGFAKAEEEVTSVMAINIGDFERLDDMIVRAQACKVAVLREIERRREGWGARVATASEKVIEAALFKTAGEPAQSAESGALPSPTPKSSQAPSGAAKVAP